MWHSNGRFPPCFSPFVGTFSHRSSALIKKLILRKLLRTPKNLSRPRRPFWGPLEAIFDFAGGERVPPSPLGWYLWVICIFMTWLEFDKIYQQLFQESSKRRPKKEKLFMKLSRRTTRKQHGNHRKIFRTS